jgi:lipopolysaccharide transport system permease protein
MSGLACWNYFLSVTVQGCQCLFQGEHYIRQYPAPLAIYPLRTALGGTIHFLIALALAVVLTWGMQGFGNLPALIYLVPAVVLWFLLTWSLAVLGGFANVYFQDTQHLTEVGFQILFYATPIMYPPKMLQQIHLEWLLRYNPLVYFLKLIQDPLLECRAPHLRPFLGACVITAFAVGLASLVLSRLEKRLIFQL